MKEAYCNYKMSMLLKEKGFNEYCSGYYKFDKSLGILSKAVINNSALDDDGIDISAPTHQMVLAWLREVHNIHIVIHPSSGVYYGKYCLSIYVQRVKNKDFNLTYQTHEDTYEKAVEEGISYSLINLIKDI